MGMDLIGKKPRSEAGKSFHRNIWGWGELWRFCTESAPALAARVKSPYTNDGDGLNSRDAKNLAKEIRTRISTVPKKLNFGYEPDQEDLLEFAQFLENCGGFEIW